MLPHECAAVVNNVCAVLVRDSMSIKKVMACFQNTKLYVICFPCAYLIRRHIAIISQNTVHLSLYCKNVYM